MQANPVVRYHNKPTRGNAIKAACAQCCGCTKEHIEPNFRRNIRECMAVECALWYYRPYQPKEKQHDNSTSD